MSADSEEPSPHCPVCGTVIPAGAPGGMCPRCLLIGGTDAAMPGPISDTPPPPTTDDPDRTVFLGTWSASRKPEDLNAYFPDLEVIDLLGAGGMGAVYRARQPRLNREVALKILSCAPQHYADFALRFEREAQTLAKLNHPNIVTIFDFGEREGLFYFVMEFVNGTDLNGLIKSGELTPLQCTEIIQQICDAMQFAHDEGITHRDIKPANILMDSKGRVKIADFGLAKMTGGEEEILSTGLTMTGTSMGTPHYMAPEQWDHSESVDHRADIYSLGVVFYELLTGERPAGVFAPPSKLKPEVDARLDTVVLRAMEKDPDRRYQQAREIRDDVTRITTTTARGWKRKKNNTASPSGTPKAPLFASLAMIALGALLWVLDPMGWKSEPVPSDTAAVTPSEDAPPKAQTPGKAQPFPLARPDRSGTPGTVTLIAESSKPGRLRGAGKLRGGKSVDLTNAEGITDFTQVILTHRSWVGLREDGSLVSSERQGKAVTHVSRLLPAFNSSFGYIDQQGQLVITGSANEEGVSNGVMQIPQEVQAIGVVDAMWYDGDAIALLKDGTVRVWGESYEKDYMQNLRWPIPEADILKDVVDIAKTRGRSAVLKADGTVHIWGGYGDKAGPFDLEKFRTFGEVTYIESGWSTFLVRFEQGRVMKLGGGRPMTGGVIAEKSDRIFSFGIRVDGRWSLASSVAITPDLENAITQLEGMEPGQFAVFENPLEKTLAVAWIEPVDAPAGTVAKQSASPGRLRAAGTQPGGQPYDLSKVEGFDDIIDVGGRIGEWVALRANGETISAKGDADFTGIDRVVWSFAQNFALIDSEGKLRFPKSRPRELPADFDDAVIVDAQLGNEHGLALTDDGRALVFGKRYDEPVGDPTQASGYGTLRWPVPPKEILTGIKDIAVTQTHAATLKHDGTLSVSGWEGVLELPQPKGLSRIEALGSSEDQLLLIDAEGQVWRCPLPRNPSPDQPVYGGGKTIVSISEKASATALNGECWHGESGRWHSYDSNVDAQLESLSTGAARKLTVSVSNHGGKVAPSLLWIEPVDAPAKAGAGQ